MLRDGGAGGVRNERVYMMYANHRIVWLDIAKGIAICPDGLWAYFHTCLALQFYLGIPHAFVFYSIGMDYKLR